ncbi:MAG: shikimate kinase [Deltaproteobacteria bacterium]|nr:shikimate kinase [Deltaproteobacteria bacterium]
MNSQNKNNQKGKIILTGYRAAGKTCVGKELARQLDWSFIDTDALIVKRAGGEISKIVRQHGWDYFRAQEKQVLKSLIERTGVVIATGGGAIIHQDIWPELMASGLVVWLKADKETICRRLRGDDNSAAQRPSLTGGTICQEVARVLKERQPLYRRGSHLAVDTASLDIAAAAKIIIAGLNGMRD